MPDSDLLPLNLELGMIRHVDDTEQRIMKRIDDIYERINSTTSELRMQHNHDMRHIHDRIDTVESNLTEQLAEQSKDIGAHFAELGDKMDARFTKIDNRVTALERWQWTIVGGAITVLFFFSNFIIKHFPLNPLK
jgi:tetrahydromethanopterin S-methyltransferase subunit G